MKGLDGSTTSRDSHDGLDEKPIYDNATQKLAMCDDPKAVWVAIYMVQSHHFLGTQAFKIEPKVALDHFFSAYRLAVVSLFTFSTASNFLFGLVVLNDTSTIYISNSRLSIGSSLPPTSLL